MRGSPVQRVILHLRDEEFLFSAGQYLEVVHPSGRSIPLSIASSPLRLPELEIHYRSTSGAQEAADMDALLAAGEAFTLRGPLGEVRLDAADARPLLLVAGGTGAAQALAIIEDLMLRNAPQPVTVLCCADEEADFYFRSSLQAIHEPWFEAVFVADPRRTPDNAGMRWLAEHGERYRDHRIILCGSPPFVYAAGDTLVAAGVNEQALESDVFTYAPRG